MNFRFAAGLAFTLTALCGAQAQSLHRCSTPSGSTYVSEAPCAQSSDQFSTESGTSKEIPLVLEVEPLMKYLSPRCANLLDDLRNARERRLPNVSDLNRGYYRECHDEEMRAANRLAAEQADKSRKGKP